jgi:hypothetical protein
MSVIESLKIEKQTLESKEIDAICKLIKDFSDIARPEELLPTSVCDQVSFIISNTFTGMANAIRRCLMAEIETQCLHFEKENLETTDDYILYDALVKNINMIPIYQDAALEAKQVLYLYSKNNSHNFAEVMASEFVIADNSHSPPKESAAKKIMAETTLPIVRLMTARHINIKKCEIVRGFAYQDAAKFTLLNSVAYEPLDVTPYDPFTGEGVSSTRSNPTKFAISYITKGNIKPKEVMLKCCDSLIARLNTFNDMIKARAIDSTEQKPKSDANAAGSNMIVTSKEDLHIYKCYGFYNTIGNLLAQKCYLLDENILHCSSTVERLDTEILILKLRHTTPNKLLMEACASCCADLVGIRGAFE